MLRIPRLARYTWSRQWYAVGLIGVSVGIFQLTPFLVKRSLDAGPLFVPLLIAIWQVPWILAPAIEPLLARAHPQRAWRWMGFLAHAPLLLIAFWPTRWPLLIALGLYYLVSIAYIPHRGALMRANYALHVRGRMYGFIQAISLLGMVLANKAGGKLMDSDPDWMRFLYPAAAVVGALGFWLHGRIRWRGQQRPRKARAHTTWREVIRILREDHAFRTYEIGFMIYGIAFLSGWGLLFLYAEGSLQLSYDQLTDATGYAFPLALMLGAAVWGRWSDSLGVVRLTAYAFFSLALFYSCMPFVSGHLGFVFAFACFGFSMAGVDVGWSLGPLRFAPDGQAHMYAAVHFSMVGIRSLFAPFLGYGVMRLFGYDSAFLCSATLLVIATVVLWRLSRRST